jgi:hypothetical protein
MAEGTHDCEQLDRAALALVRGTRPIGDGSKMQVSQQLFADFLHALRPTPPRADNGRGTNE